MPEFWLEVLANLAANIISWGVLISVAGIGIVINACSKRAALFRFFGIDRLIPSVTVYLTTIIVQRGGAKGIDDRLTRTWEGPAVSARAIDAVKTVPSMFHSTFTDTLPAFARRLLSTKYWSFEPIAVNLHPSPLNVSEIAHGPLLCLGAPGFNLASKYYMETAASYVEFLPDYKFCIKRGGLTGKIISPSGGTVKVGDGTERPANDLGLVSRLVDHEYQRKVFIVAGTGSNGTRAAIEYLTHNWLELDKRFRDIDFAIVLECPNRRKDPQGYKDAKVIQEFPSRDS